MPDADGRAESIIASPATGAPVYAFAGLPTALPEGNTLLELEEQGSPADAALGWALGSYAFTAYTTPKRAPATLVWPAGADRARSRARCAQRVSGARHDQHAGGRHGPRTSRRRRQRRSPIAHGATARRHRRRRSAAAKLSDDPHRRPRERAAAAADRSCAGETNGAQGHAGRQGRVLRYRRPRPQDARRDAADEKGHGRRRRHAGARQRADGRGHADPPSPADSGGRKFRQRQRRTGRSTSCARAAARPSRSATPTPKAA